MIDRAVFELVARERPDVLLVTLRREPIFAYTIPSKLQSYLACGRPVLAALEGEGARIVKEAAAGWAVPAEDPRSLADAVLAASRLPRPQRDIRFWWANEVSAEYQWFAQNPGDRKNIFVNINQDMVGAHQTIGGLSRVRCMTLNDAHLFVRPDQVKQEIAGVAHPFMVDVPDFRTANHAKLREDIFRMTEQHFLVAKHFLRTRPWDFFMMVEMGTDRIHHGFWKYMDATHLKHEPGNPYQDVIRKYYKFCDEKLGELLQFADDETSVLVVSDHGARKMDGGICINEWLMKEASTGSIWGAKQFLGDISQIGLQPFIHRRLEATLFTLDNRWRQP